MEIRDPDSEQTLQFNPEPRRRTRRRRTMNFWTRTMFQRIFFKSLVRLIIYLYKLYEDFGAVNTYHHEHAFYMEIVSLLCLILPPMVFAIYQSFAEFIKNDDFSAKAIITKFVNGLLLIPWQIKRHLDGLYFSSQNLCSFRAPKDYEQENMLFINRNAETLEFFEDFYAGFIQVTMQLYILSVESQSRFTLIVGEIIGSALSIFSMLIAIRRRDDGPLTGFLSFIGWISMFASRVIVFALAATIIHNWLILLLSIHVLAFTYWVYRIAMQALEDDTSPQRAKKKGFSILILIFFFFGLPSLVMWPIMFHLKEKQRPLKFFIVCFIENITLGLIWYFVRHTNEKADMYWLLAILITTLVATLFLSLYVCLKPPKTDQVVLHEMRYTDTDSYGIYFEFCDIVFNLAIQREVRELLDIISQQPELVDPKAAQNSQNTRNNTSAPSAPTN